MSTYPNIIAAKDARIAELEAEVERLTSALDRAADRMHRAEALASTGAVKVKALDEDDYEEIISAAAINMRKATSGIRGQVVTVQDSLDWWVMKETERHILSSLTAGKPEQSGWQPIETAPKDGTQFQAWIEKYGWEPHTRFNPDSEAFELWGRVDYDKDGWDVYPHMVPTHWMPLPTPPTAGGGDA